MPKFKPWREDQHFLLPPTLEEFVPAGHLARVVSGIVDELDTTDIERKYSRLGQNTYHPKICLLYTSPSPRDLSTSRMPSSA